MVTIECSVDAGEKKQIFKECDGTLKDLSASLDQIMEEINVYITNQIGVTNG